MRRPHARSFTEVRRPRRISKVPYPVSSSVPEFAAANEWPNLAAAVHRLPCSLLLAHADPASLWSLSQHEAIERGIRTRNMVCSVSATEHSSTWVRNPLPSLLLRHPRRAQLRGSLTHLTRVNRPLSTAPRPQNCPSLAMPSQTTSARTFRKLTWSTSIHGFSRHCPKDSKSRES